MIRWLLPAVLVIAGGLYYALSYPPVVLKAKTEAALERLETSVKLKDRDAIAESFNQLLAEDAQLQLDVRFSSFGTLTADPSVVQDFNKSQFVLFIDNVLYPLTDYGYEVTLEDFTLSDDEKTADIRFTSQQWAEGVSLMGGMRLAMRYNSHANCKGQVGFEEKRVFLTKVSCSLNIIPMANETAADIIKKLNP